MRRLCIVLALVVMATTCAALTSSSAGADRPVRSHPAKRVCEQTTPAGVNLRRQLCPTAPASSPAPAVSPGFTTFPAVSSSTSPPWQNTATPGSISPHVSFSYGWLIYVHWTHNEVAKPAWYAAAGALGASGLLACAGLGPVAAVCGFLFAAAGIFMGYLFQEAWARGGGLVLEFTYWLAPWGYEYVGNNWS